MEQPEAAHRLNVQQPTLCRYERDRRTPAIDLISRAAVLYAVDFTWLATGAGNAKEGGDTPNETAGVDDAPKPTARPEGDSRDGDANVDATVDRLLGLLEKFERDIERALSVADKNADGVKTATETVKQMAADTHHLIERLPRHPGRVPEGAPREPAAGQ